MTYAATTEELVRNLTEMRTSAQAIVDGGGAPAIGRFFEDRLACQLHAIPVMRMQEDDSVAVNEVLTRHGLSTDLTTHLPAINAAANDFIAALASFVDAERPRYVLETVSGDILDTTLKARMLDEAQTADATRKTRLEQATATQTGQAIRLRYPASWTNPPSGARDVAAPLLTALANFGVS